MKKSVAAALTAAFVVGVSSSAFAAANPFSDVPAGHWAYQSVAKLAAAGVVEGYGDGTYRGDRNITRYEMAQMVAKAMAKNPEGASKAELDRLAAEFRDELDALGVRVAELEKYADKVVWNGELRYRYRNERIKTPDGGKIKTTRNWILMRLDPTATVNDHWKVKARLDATSDMKEDSSTDFKLKRAYAQGNYGKFQFNVGKMEFYTNVDDGMLIDDEFSGFQAIYGDKFKVALMAGRWSGTDIDVKGADGELLVKGDPASYQGGEISYDNDKLYIGAGFHHFRSDYFTTLHDTFGSRYNKNTHNASVWAVGAHYNFDKLQVRGAYAQNTKAKDWKKSWTAGLAYGSANRTEPGTWDISADYRYVSPLVSLAPTYDAAYAGSKGVEFSVRYVPLYNTRIELKYFTGKDLATEKNARAFFSRVSWFF